MQQQQTPPAFLLKPAVVGLIAGAIVALNGSIVLSSYMHHEIVVVLSFVVAVCLGASAPNGGTAWGRCLLFCSLLCFIQVFSLTSLLISITTAATLMGHSIFEAYSPTFYLGNPIKDLTGIVITGTCFGILSYLRRLEGKGAFQVSFIKKERLAIPQTVLVGFRISAAVLVGIYLGYLGLVYFQFTGPLPMLIMTALGIGVCGIVAYTCKSPRLVWARALILTGFLDILGASVRTCEQLLSTNGLTHATITFLPTHLIGPALMAIGILLLLWRWIDKDSFIRFSGEDYTEVDYTEVPTQEESPADAVVAIESHEPTYSESPKLDTSEVAEKELVKTKDNQSTTSEVDWL